MIAPGKFKSTVKVNKMWVGCNKLYSIFIVLKLKLKLTHEKLFFIEYLKMINYLKCSSIIFIP